MNRGARRAPIFTRDEHCLIFLTCLGEAMRRNGVEVHAYSLMPNHYHLLLRSTKGKLSKAMQELNGRYTQILNQRYGWDGPLFRGRFRSQLVHHAPSLEHLFAYIHLNPFLAGLARDVDEHCWTSLLAYLGEEKRPRWLTVSAFLKALGGRAGVRRLIERRRKRPEEWPEGMNLETGRLPRVEKPERIRQIELPFGRECPRQVPVEETLAKVCSIVGSSPGALRRPDGCHDRFSSAQRFAVWALTQEHGYSSREIGRVLGMNPTQVYKVRHLLRKHRPSERIRRWMEQFSSDDE